MGEIGSASGEASASAYLDEALANLSSPHPICIGMADDLVAHFITDWEAVDHVSALKMFSWAWSSLRSSTLMARVGMVPQVPAVQRLALESIVYGVLFRYDEEFHDLWKKRHKDALSLVRFRREGWGRALEVLAKENSNLARRAKRIYQALIDLGAHPNPVGIDQISRYEFADGGEFGTAIYSHLIGQPYIDFSHLNTTLIYDVLIESIMLIWPERANRLSLPDRAAKVGRSTRIFIKALREETPSA